MPSEDSRYRLLLIEDDLNLADAIATRFGNAGFRVLRVGTGTLGLEIATAREIDLLMLDLKLPDMRGEKVLEIVRRRSNLPVLIISSNRDEQSKIGGLNLGADGYITKPFSLKELEAHARAILRRSTVSTLSRPYEDTAKPHTRLQCHGVELFLDSREAYVDGETLELSPTEFGVLRYLIERAGIAVTAEQLLATVWGYDGYDRHIVETNVYRLRQKIEKDAGTPERLVTVRGYGYKFTTGNNHKPPTKEKRQSKTKAAARA